MLLVKAMLVVIAILAILSVEGLVRKKIVVGSEMYFRSWYHLFVFMALCASVMILFINIAYIIVYLLLGGA